MKKALAGEVSHVPQSIQPSMSRWFEFETEVPDQDANLDSLNRVHWEIRAKIEAMDSAQQAPLDIGTETAVYGEQKHIAYKGHFESTADHPSLLFNGEVDRLAANLPPENVCPAGDCNEALKNGESCTRFPATAGGPQPPNEPAIYQACGAAIPAASESPAPSRPDGVATTTAPQVKPLHKPPWWKVAMAAVIAALVIACSIAYNNRRPASPIEPVLQKSNALEQKAPFVSPKQLVTDTTTNPLTAPGAKEEAKAARSRHQRVRVGENEIDIGEDVTVRYFSPQQVGQDHARNTGDGQ